MYVSMAAEKAAKPMPPKSMARGPLLRARTAPEIKPAYTELYKSFLARNW